MWGWSPGRHRDRPGITALAGRVGIRAACAARAAVGAAPAGYYRRHRASPGPLRPAAVAHGDRVQPRALSSAARRAIVEVLHSNRFADLAPAQVRATLRAGHPTGTMATARPCGDRDCAATGAVRRPGLGA